MLISHFFRVAMATHRPDEGEMGQACVQSWPLDLMGNGPGRIEPVWRFRLKAGGSARAKKSRNGRPQSGGVAPQKRRRPRSAPRHALHCMALGKRSQGQVCAGGCMQRAAGGHRPFTGRSVWANFRPEKHKRPRRASCSWAAGHTTAPRFSSDGSPSFLVGLIRSSRLTPSHMAIAAATKTEE